MKCKHCGSTEITEDIKDTIDLTPCEIEYKCAQCGKSIAYWAHGAFEPSFEE